MKVLFFRNCSALAGLTATFALTYPLAAGEQSVAEFKTDENQKLGWSVVDDGVMGGLSRGELSFTDSGALQFQGELSLANNGGFSTVRTGQIDLDLGGSDGLVMRVKGDGRKYEVRLSSDARYRGSEVSFSAPFPTTDDWKEVRVPFSDFTGSFRGMDLKDETLNPSQIERVGFLIGDKKAGQIDLQVEWVRTYANDKKSADRKESKSEEKGQGLVDAVLSDGRFKTLAAALTEAELIALLQEEGPFTVFAPTDEAFAKLPKGKVNELLKPENRETLKSILTYHVSSGTATLAEALKAGNVATAQGGTVQIGFDKGRVRVNDAAVIDADIRCANGIVHVIDSVLLPPAPPQPDGILAKAKAAGSFGTLLAAIDAAGLTDALTGDGPFTVLAPTDEAFAKLPKGKVAELLKPENREALKSILTYHVFSGNVSAGDALNARSAATLNGASVQFAIREGRFTANDANVVAVDIGAANGTIHVINSVLIPEAGSSKGKGSETAEANGDNSPLGRIEIAIDKGVPLYNDGDAAVCAKVYQDCIRSLAADTEIDSKVRRTLDAVLDRAENGHSDDARAWLYRKTLDGMMIHLQHSGN